MATYSSQPIPNPNAALVKAFPTSVRAGGSPRPASGQLWPRGVPTALR